MFNNNVVFTAIVTELQNFNFKIVSINFSGILKIAIKGNKPGITDHLFEAAFDKKAILVGLDFKTADGYQYADIDPVVISQLGSFLRQVEKIRVAVKND